MVFKRKKEMEDIKEIARKTDITIKKAVMHFNKVHDLLFNGSSLTKNDLLELKQIMSVSGSFAILRIGKYNDKINSFAKKGLKTMNIMVAISSVFFILSIFNPLIFILNIIPMFVIFRLGKEIPFLDEIANKRKYFGEKSIDFCNRYDNYANTINNRLEKILEEPTKCGIATLNALEIMPDVLMDYINYLNDLIDGKKNINEVPDDMKNILSLILARNLGVEVTDLEVLLKQAKAEFNKNIQERVRER